jgi:hypothetical protein
MLAFHRKESVTSTPRPESRLSIIEERANGLAAERTKLLARKSSIALPAVMGDLEAQEELGQIDARLSKIENEENTFDFAKQAVLAQIEASNKAELDRKQAELQLKLNADAKCLVGMALERDKLTTCVKEIESAISQKSYELIRAGVTENSRLALIARHPERYLCLAEAVVQAAERYLGNSQIEIAKGNQNHVHE